MYIYLIPGIEVLNLHKFTAKIKMKNATSIALFEKIGFKEVKLARHF